MPKNLRSNLIVLSILAVIVAGCSGDPSSLDGASGGSATGSAGRSSSQAPAEGTGAPAAANACEFLTDADIKELTGRTVASRKPGQAMGIYPDGCEWFFEDDPDNGLAQLVVGTFATGGRGLWERSWVGVAEDVGLEPVSGIGEGAFRQGTGSFATIQGDRIVDVFYLQGGFGRADEEDATAKALLVRALARATGAPVHAGGGGIATPDAGTGNSDICALLDAAQIEEFVQAPLEVARPLAAGCRWVLESDSPVPDRFNVTVDVTRSGGRAQFDALSALEPVPGIGDGAVKSGGNTDGTAWALTGDTLVKLQYALPLTTIDADPVVLPLLELIVNGL